MDHWTATATSKKPQKIWNNLPQRPVARTIQNFRKRLQVYVDTAGGQFEHLNATSRFVTQRYGTVYRQPVRQPTILIVNA